MESETHLRHGIVRATSVAAVPRSSAARRERHNRIAAKLDVRKDLLFRRRWKRLFRERIELRGVVLRKVNREFLVPQLRHRFDRLRRRQHGLLCQLAVQAYGMASSTGSCVDSCEEHFYTTTFGSGEYPESWKRSL